MNVKESVLKMWEEIQSEENSWHNYHVWNTDEQNDILELFGIERDNMDPKNFFVASDFLF